MLDDPSFSSIPNNVIANRYRLVERLGHGTFGQVFLAHDLKFTTPRPVALKLLHPKFLNEPGMREDFLREANNMARFNHPNILRVIDFDVSKTMAYIVTDLAEGRSLAIKLRPDPTKPPVRMSLDLVSSYLEQLADALDDAHAKGLIHRDIKPLNILLDRRDRPMIADFGLATALAQSQASSALVEANISGTPLYMAPEQWKGQAGKASDIYALAVMTYQMITGQTPFQGSQMALMGQHIGVPVPRLSERAPDLVYPPALDDVILAGMAKDPKYRTRSALEFYRRFQAALDTTSNLTFAPAAPVPPELAPAEVAKPLAQPSATPSPAPYVARTEASEDTLVAAQAGTQQSSSNSYPTEVAPAGWDSEIGAGSKDRYSQTEMVNPGVASKKAVPGVGKAEQAAKLQGQVVAGVERPANRGGLKWDRQGVAVGIVGLVLVVAILAIIS